MEEIVAQLIALISDADQAIENIDNLQADLEQAISETDPEVLEEYSGYLANACDLLDRFEQALREDGRPDLITRMLGVGTASLGNEEFLLLLQEHSSTLNELCPQGSSITALMSHVNTQLLSTHAELMASQNGQGWFGSGDVNREEILAHITPLKHGVCRASERFNDVVGVLTLRQFRDFLAETSNALKDVVIVGADVVIITNDMTFTMAVKSGFSIFTGVRSLHRRIGRYTESVIRFFGG